MTQKNFVKINLDALNTMDEQKFTNLLGEIFEHSPEIAQKSWHARPFSSIEILHNAMMDEVRALEAEEKKIFFNRHPELSAEAVRKGGLTSASITEQSSAGLHTLSQDEESDLQRMNYEYRSQHGFPFIICVRHYTKAGIFFELQSRIDRSTDFELNYALNQIKAITFSRLSQVISA